MSSREIAYELIDCLTDEQVEGFVQMLRSLVNTDKTPNETTLEAVRECEKLLSDKNTVAYDVEDALTELKK